MRDEGKSEGEIRAAQPGGATESDKMPRSLLVVCSYNWPKVEFSRNLEAAASESWEHWCVNDVQDGREDEQDQKLGPQTLPAIFWDLEAEAGKANCVRDPGMQTDEVYTPESW